MIFFMEFLLLILWNEILWNSLYNPTYVEELFAWM